MVAHLITWYARRVAAILCSVRTFDFLLPALAIALREREREREREIERERERERDRVDASEKDMIQHIIGTNADEPNGRSLRLQEACT